MVVVVVVVVELGVVPVAHDVPGFYILFVAINTDLPPNPRYNS